MYDRSDLHRASSYSYPQYATQPAPKQYPTAHSTSSAFSASANPNEDWTKISDLAERRRIQNRIAQRNYRKKLKKRLEDLERRAGSSSASPEQRHEELTTTGESPSSQPSPQPGTQRQRSSSSQIRRDRTPEVFHQQYALPSSEDPGMFSQHHTRQMSTSPPPFSYSTISTTDSVSYSTYPQISAYSMPGNGADMPLYPQYIHTPQHNYQHIVPSMTSPPVKQEYYNDDSDINPFSMGFASLGGGSGAVDISAANSYQGSVASYTPALSDCFDHSQAGSPPESLYYPTTPPLDYAPLMQTFGKL